MSRKIRVLIPFGAMAVVLSIASVAWACIAVQGPTEITEVVPMTAVSAQAECPEGETCAAPGDFIKVKATQTKPDLKFFLHFRNYKRTSTMGTSCYGSRIDGDVRISRTARVSDAKGNIRVTKGQIPETAKPTSEYAGALGPAMVCFIDETRDVTTQADTLTII